VKVVKSKALEGDNKASMTLRLKRELHRELVECADANDVSLNHLIVKILETALSDKNFKIEI